MIEQVDWRFHAQVRGFGCKGGAGVCVCALWDTDDCRYLQNTLRKEIDC
jgi:hypothetical protein